MEHGASRAGWRSCPRNERPAAGPEHAGPALFGQIRTDSYDGSAIHGRSVGLEAACTDITAPHDLFSQLLP